ISVVIRERERVGLVGRNGTGKSTLLRILSGNHAPDTGEIVQQPDTFVGYLPQEFDLDNSMDVRSNIRQGAKHILDLIAEYENPATSDARHHEVEHRLILVDGWDLDVRIDTLADRLSLPDFNRDVSTL